MIIENGAEGACYVAKVDDKNRLHVNSSTETHAQISSIDGRGYNINTGVINLTSAGKSVLLYVKNNELNDLVVESMFYLIGNSTGGSGDVLISVRRNPTAGSIITNAVNCEMTGVNRNFGSNKTLTLDAFKGVEGDTITASGGKVVESIFNQAPTRAALDVGYIIMPQGTSISIEITPATGNTSLDVEFALAVHLEA